MSSRFFGGHDTVADVRITTNSEGHIVDGLSTFTLAGLPMPMPQAAGPHNIVTLEQIVNTLHRIGWTADFGNATGSDAIETSARHLDGDRARRARKTHELWLVAGGRAHAVVWTCGAPAAMLRVVPDWTTENPKELITDAIEEANRRQSNPDAASDPFVVMLGTHVITDDLREGVNFLNEHPDVLLVLMEET